MSLSEVKLIDGSNHSLINQASRTDTTVSNSIKDTHKSTKGIAYHSMPRGIKHQDTVYVSSSIKATIGSWQREGANVTLTKNSVFRVVRSGDEMNDELWCLELLDIFNSPSPSHLPHRERREQNIFFPHRSKLETPLKLTNPHRLIDLSYQKQKEKKKVPLHTLLGTVSSKCGKYLLRRVGLPDDIGNHVMSFLEVQPLNFDEVVVTGASSTRGHFPIESVLGNEKTWWLSAKGSMHNETCEEHLEFRLCPNTNIKRLSYVGVSIPPLPHGPVSVRRFRIDYSQNNGKSWTRGGKEYTLETMDFNGIQTFKLCPPIDASNVRLVCLQNAFAAENVYISGMTPFDCVGLFHVRFK